MIRTSNYNLGLWEGTDYPNYTMPNENMNIIDTNLKSIETKATESLSKANASVERLGDVDIKAVETRGVNNSVGVATNRSLIDAVKNEIEVITSTTKEEKGTRVIRNVDFTFVPTVEYMEKNAVWCGTVEINADRFGLDVEDNIRVLSVTPTTTNYPVDNKSNYLLNVNYVGKKNDGKLCFNIGGVTPNTSAETNAIVNLPDGLIIEFIKL